jgi:hypothetical protein
VDVVVKLGVEERGERGEALGGNGLGVLPGLNLFQGAAEPA